MIRRRVLLAVVLMETAAAVGCGSKVELSSSNECEAGTTTCNSMCVDTATDPSNCGWCEHYCGIAPCNSGVCGEAPLMFVPSTGAFILGLAADSTNLYWATQYELYSMPIEGGTRRLIALADPNDSFFGPLVVRAGRAYLQGGVSNKLLSVPVSGGSFEVIENDVYHLSGLAADETGVYWSKSDPAEIWRSSGDASSNQLVASGIDKPLGIALDSDAIYWRTLAGSVIRLPKQGGAPTEVAWGASRDMVVNAYGVVYVVEDSIDAILMLSPHDGGPVRELLACRGDSHGIAADDQGIYWSGCNRRGTLAFPPGGGEARDVSGRWAGRIVPAGDWLFLLEDIESSIYRARRNP